MYPVASDGAITAIRARPFPLAALVVVTWCFSGDAAVQAQTTEAERPTVAPAASPRLEPSQVDNTASRVTSPVTRLGNLTPVQVPESDLQRAELPEAGLRPAGFARPGLQVGAGRATITVTRPNAEDYWISGTTQAIRWNSSNLQAAVKIDLVHAESAQQYTFNPVAAVTENDGAFDYLVPDDLHGGWSDFYIQIATLDDSTKAFSPPLEVYHEPVDMTCQIVGIRQDSEYKYYVFVGEEDEYLKFDVWVRNNGTQQQVTVTTVKLLVIKEPEEVLIRNGDQEFGFGNMAPRIWYKTPEPRRYRISHEDTWTQYTHGRRVDLENGAYRVEVHVDPLNTLNEDEVNREDNYCVQRFVIE